MRTRTRKKAVRSPDKQSNGRSNITSETNNLQFSTNENQVVSNPLIVSRILSFLSGHKFLECRLLNKLWNDEVLNQYPKRDNPTLSVGRFIEMGQYNGDSLPSNSALSKRITIVGYGTPICKTPKQFLSFCQEHRNAEVITLRISNEEFQGSLTWGKALVTVFENYCPNLNQLVIEGAFGMEGFIRCPARIRASFFLSNLKTLVISHAKNGAFFSFANKILESAPNLEELSFDADFFPTLTANRKLIKLHFKCISWNGRADPEFERVLEEVSQSLEDLRLPVLHADETSFPEITLEFPRMPKLRKYATADFRLNPFPFLSGDFLRFLTEKMPLLESLQLRRNPIEPDTEIDVIYKAICRSSVTNSTITKLFIPTPENITLLSGIGEKFVSLTELCISSNVDGNSAENVDQAIMEIGELLVELASLRPPRVRNIKLFVHPKFCEDNVKEEICERIRSEGIIIEGPEALQIFPFKEDEWL